MIYSKIEECPISRKEIELVAFFRHKGLYMCHAYYKDHTERFNFYLTEKMNFSQKGKQERDYKNYFQMQ